MVNNRFLKGHVPCERVPNKQLHTPKCEGLGFGPPQKEPWVNHGQSPCPPHLVDGTPPVVSTEAHAKDLEQQLMQEPPANSRGAEARTVRRLGP